MIKYLRRSKYLILRLITYTILGTAFISMMPISTKLLIESVNNINFSYILILIGIYVGSIIGFLFFEYAKKLLSAKLQRKINLEIKNDVFSNLLKNKHSNNNMYDDSYYINLLTHDVDVIFSKYYSSILDLYVSLLSFAVYFIVMLFVDYILALIIVTACLLSLIIPKLFGNKISDKEVEASKKEELFINKIDELLSGKSLYDDKTFNSFYNNFSKSNTDLENSIFKLNKTIYKSHIVSGFSLYFVNIVAFISGMILIYFKISTLANFVAILAYIDSIAIPTGDLIYEIITLKSTKGIREKFHTSLKHCEDKAFNKEFEFNTIIADDLSFKYANDEYIINSLNLKINRGDKIAIVGKNGCGKSTLIKLLCKELDGYTGTLLINSLDVKEYNLGNLLFYSPQTNPIFNGSLEENVTIFGSYDFTIEDEIKDIGLSHLLGRNEPLDISCLSSGEISKIQILRALNTKKEILMFDEIFANVDKESEIKLTDYLLSLNKTVVIITHNLNEDNLSKFDSVINLSK